MKLSIAIGAALLAGVAMTGQAGAVVVVRNHLSHGGANCQSALPVFDTQIRKRPQAVANEGTSYAFVTCDTENMTMSGSNFPRILVMFVNRSAAGNSQVTCTLVDGALSTAGEANFFVKSSPTIAVDTVSSISWDATDNGGMNFSFPAVSCNLPAGMDIGIVRFDHLEDVGA